MRMKGTYAGRRLLLFVWSFFARPGKKDHTINVKYQSAHLRLNTPSYATDQIQRERNDRRVERAHVQPRYPALPVSPGGGVSAECCGSGGRSAGGLSGTHAAARD